MAKDKPGIVKFLSDAVFEQQGSWLESSLSRLGGQFAGIISVKIPLSNMNAFKSAISSVDAAGIKVCIQSQDASRRGDITTSVVQLEANDRQGIVEEISSILASKKVNIEKIVTGCVSASMAGYDLFQAEITVGLPEGFEVEDLQALLEEMSEDVMVSVI